MVRTRIQAFPALILTFILVGLLAGRSPADTVDPVAKGFGNTRGHIGIIIVYFWVVTRFSGMDVNTSLKSWTLSTALIPVCGAVIIILASLFV